jgi:hypothetical protein
VLFTRAAHAGLVDGSTTTTFRRWKRAQAKVGGVYRVGPVDLTVDRLTRVPIDRISDRDARQSGFADRGALLKFLGSPAPGATDDLVWRVDFHCEAAAAAPAPSGELTATDVDTLRRRLERLDAASATGPWTRAVLRLIETRPGVVSTDLAAELGRERMTFKADVRKLKRLGLTESLAVGYRLSLRGRAFLDKLG